jgi:hypothetical protein
MGGNIFAKKKARVGTRWEATYLQKKRPEEVLEVQPQFSAKRSSIITTGY